MEGKVGIRGGEGREMGVSGKERGGGGREGGGRVEGRG